MRRDVGRMVAGQRRREIDRTYRDALTRLPETGAELAEATDLAVNAINDEPWERWW